MKLVSCALVLVLCVGAIPQPALAQSQPAPTTTPASTSAPTTPTTPSPRRHSFGVVALEVIAGVALIAVLAASGIHQCRQVDDNDGDEGAGTGPADNDDDDNLCGSNNNDNSSAFRRRGTAPALQIRLPFLRF